MSLRNVFIVLLCACLLPFAFSCKKQSGETIKIGAIFSVTGPASFLGAPESKTAEMLIDEINGKGGIDGKTIKLIVKDSAGSPEKAISFAKQLIEEEKVFAIIGPSTSGESMKIKSICEEAKMILISCAAAEVIVNPVATYVFKSPQNDRFAAEKIYEVMKKKGITKIGIVSSNDGFGLAGKEQLEKLAPSKGITILISEVYDKKATDLTGVLTKLKAKNVQAVVNWSIVPAQSIVAKNMKQLNMTCDPLPEPRLREHQVRQGSGRGGRGDYLPRRAPADSGPACGQPSAKGHAHEVQEGLRVEIRRGRQHLRRACL